ncbi:MAG TPA: AraD1 family protein [Chitinophagaceae bacterium]|nr:AraD1 family protein [Chitinophagaceae bacterium]
MKESTRLVQLSHPANGRKLALVQEPYLVLLNDVPSAYDLALLVIESGENIHSIIKTKISDSKLEYDPVYNGLSDWQILPSFDCPGLSSNCIVSGTGLTHKNSALNRQMMHAAEGNTLTDSMKIYQWGLEGGQPEKGTIGTQPEWFYKGTGSILKGHGQTLPVPVFANDGGEEPEVAGVYIIDSTGQPVRIGFTTGNEFSDHVMEKKNYLYLAPSKLRNCAIGPELVIDMGFVSIEGTVSVTRDNRELWSARIHTGEQNMAHSLANLEYHHFKYADHRQPLQAHVHFFGADAFSFGAGVKLETGDEMQVHWEGMGRALINPIQLEKGTEQLINVQSITESVLPQ